jgi:hypothetical protein
MLLVCAALPVLTLSSGGSRLSSSSSYGPTTTTAAWIAEFQYIMTTPLPSTLFILPETYRRRRLPFTCILFVLQRPP